MRRFSLICAVLLLCTACVIPQIGGPDFSRQPSLGMSANEVVSMWGRPFRCAWVSLERTTQQCLWMSRTTLIMPGGYGNATKDTLYDYRSVLFLDGRVVGGDF
jgi:hypothetical protein